MVTLIKTTASLISRRPSRACCASVSGHQVRSMSFT